MSSIEDLSNCDEAFRALFDLFSDDIETQKALTIEHIESFLGTPMNGCYDDSTLIALRAKVLKARSLLDIRKALDSENNDYYKCNYMLYPAKFLMHNMSVRRGVEFIHWSMYALDIEKEGFRGRLTPHKQTNTKIVPDFVELGQGYIFAYNSYQLNDRTVIGGDNYPYYIKGTASVAIEFNFEPDRNEIQLVIPVKCILEAELVNQDTPDWMADFL